MARTVKNDRKSQQNRNRVRRYRRSKMLKARHEEYIHSRIFDDTQNQEENCENLFEDSESESIGGHVPYGDHVEDRSTLISDKLRYWALYHRITKTALSDLLSILKYSGFNFLPKDARTLMRTPVHVPISTLSNGKLWYHGVKNCLETVLGKISDDISITLDWNFDGFPISKSSNTQFWPILTSIRGTYTIFRLTRTLKSNAAN